MVLKQIYRYAYFPIAGIDLDARRARTAAARESLDQRRGPRAPVLLRIGLGGLLGAAGAVADVEACCRETASATSIKLLVFIGILAFVGNLARLGRLPRTRPIVPGEIAVSD